MVATLRGAQSRVELSSTTIKIGHAPDNQLVVNDMQVSSHHAQIVPQDAAYAIVDLGSANGTWVNGQRTASYVLHPLVSGDTVRFDNTLSSTPTPTPSIPRLHASYSGTMTRLDSNTLIRISMSSLNEDTSGNFTAEGSDFGASGGCPASFAGIVRADNTVNFTLTETQVTNCGLVVTFKGQLFPDGHLAGDWQGPASVEKGSWTVS